MKIIKPTPLGILTRSYRAEGREHLGVAILAMATLGSTPRLVSESALWDTVGEDLGGYPLDAALPKPHAEFLVSAYAYGQYGGRTQACHIGIRFAGVEKHLQVSGDRHWNGAAISAAQPFERLPVDWPLAYGGAGHADNPRGRGIVGPAPHSDVPLPNIEYADHALSVPGQHAVPAGFAPIAPERPQRKALYGELDRRWLEEDRAGFPRTMDRRYFNVAPLDQQIPALAALPDGAAYEITRMHPEREVITGVLPALRGRCFRQQHGEDALAEVPMRLTTAWFIPHRERVVMIFHGTAEVSEFDAQDVACLLIGVQSHAHTRCAAHYRRIFDLRMDKQHGVLHALRDVDLVPAEMLNTLETGNAPSHGALQRNLMRRAQLQAEQGAASAPGAAVLPNAAAFAEEPPRPPRLDELADFVQQQTKLADEQRAALEAMRQHIEITHAALKPPAPARRGPPRPMDAERPDMPDMPCDVDQKLRQAYLHAVQYQDAAPRLDAGASDALRRRVADLHASGESLAGLDLTGADLSGMELRGALLSGALLESADLSDTDLAGATLCGAVLARASLLRTRFAGARLNDANLSLADCDGTDFSDAVLDGCVFESTRLSDCRMQRASVQRAQFRQCRFDKIDFSDATLGDLVFMEQVLRDTDFSRARIRKLAFIQCEIERVSFTQADIVGFGFVETIARHVRFDRASLRKACFVQNSVLDHTDFTHALLSEVNLRHASAKSARFSHARLSQCDLSDACLQAADLQHVKFEHGYLVRTDLRAADLTHADLIGACMRRAKLEGANLREANLFRATLAETSSDQGTQFDGAYLEQAVFHPLARPA